MKQPFAIGVAAATLLIVSFAPLVLAQNLTREDHMILRPGYPGNTVLSTVPDPPLTSSAPRGYAHYTAKDWRKLIDSTWGPGLPTDQKLQIFDGFWNNVDQYFGGFPNLSINWDSLKNVYRPEVTAGVSRGRFAAIMSYLYLALRESHTYISDLGIDSAYLVAGKWRPRGVPILYLGAMRNTGLGAILTPLPDSSLLVVRVHPDQPLSLQAGDIVLGYDRIPWTQLIRQLLEAQLPIGSRYSYWTSSPESWGHTLLTSAAVNWHLFDSIDVVKYSTGQTVHLSTSKLDVTDWDNLYGLEQIPVKGVQFPVWSPPLPSDTRYSTWGIVEGTNVGYIYIQSEDQYTANFASIAIKELVQLRKTDGLIIDLRYNIGGNTNYINVFDPLFGSEPSPSFSRANRVSAADRMSFSITPYAIGITTKHQIYDRPIAVLTGPKCYSAGDYSAFFLRGHPMVRFFGRPTNTAYVSGQYLNGNYAGKSWYYNLSKGDVYSNYPGEGHLLHKGFDVDERIWFTKDDAARGDDTIVKRALQWIAELAHGHDVNLANASGKPTKDTIKVRTLVENPQKHVLSVWSYLTDRAGVTIDSCQMFDDGLHNDGLAGDKLYGGGMKPPSKESTYDLSLRTTDVTAGTFRYITRANAYFTNGPIINRGWRSSTTDTIPNPGDVLRLRFPLANGGTIDTVKSVTATVTALDTMILIGLSMQISYGDLAPGVESNGSTTQSLKVQSYCPPNTKAKLLLAITSEGVTVRADTITLLVQAAATLVAESGVVPKEYSLSQNYPNPFNPSTIISFSLPKTSNTSLRIFNTLGQEVALLVDEQKSPGNYQIQWNANVPSGIYFYRLRAGDYVETKKMILLR